MSEELQLIKQAIEEASMGRPNQYNLTRARDAIYILESREDEIILDTIQIVRLAREELNEHFYKHDEKNIGALIGQYAYRYSEDIRKDRDEWKALAKGFVESTNEMEARR